MSEAVLGIHHITAIASDAQKTYDFYAGLLGLRLVKKTVNQDDVTAYHLFFGDKLGNPGMDLTFFVFQNVPQGTHGTGEVAVISLAVPEKSLDFWQKRLSQAKVKFDRAEDFGTQRISFQDHDGQQLQLVGVPKNELHESGKTWTTPEVSKANAIRYFYGATFTVVTMSSIESLLKDVLGYSISQKNGKSTQFVIEANGQKSFLEVTEETRKAPGINAVGTVHHIAFRVRDELHQLTIREQVIQAGLYPTQVIDRFWFKSVYFRTPAGILFELATDGPGFAVDESVEELGETLVLPPFLEKHRSQIEAGLPSITLKQN